MFLTFEPKNFQKWEDSTSWVDELVSIVYIAFLKDAIEFLQRVLSHQSYLILKNHQRIEITLNSSQIEISFLINSPYRQLCLSQILSTETGRNQYFGIAMFFYFHLCGNQFTRVEIKDEKLWINGDHIQIFKST